MMFRSNRIAAPDWSRLLADDGVVFRCPRYAPAQYRRKGRLNGAVKVVKSSARTRRLKRRRQAARRV